MSSATRLETQQWIRKLRGAPLLALGCFLIMLVALWLWLRGAHFYSLPMAARVEHPDYTRLSPSRTVGEGYGVTGLGLLLFNLAYLLRKRVPHWPVGTMRVWLDLHVLTGLAAAVFAAYHSAFQVRSPVALATTLALAITVLTGVVGRFFHALGADNRKHLAQRLDRLDQLLPGIRHPLEVALTQVVARLRQRRKGLLGLTPLLRRSRTEAVALQALIHKTWQGRIDHAAAFERPHVARVAADVERLAVRAVYAVLGRELLRAWRPWHRLCALTVIGGVTVHVGIAVFYGYL